MRSRRSALLTLVALASTAVTVSALASGMSTLGAPAGGFAAYHGTRLTTAPKDVPSNKALAYKGTKLVLAQAYIGRKAAEPTLGVDKKGDVYTVAAAFDALPGNPPKNEPRTFVMRSTDGGRTFKDDSPQVSGVRTQNVSTDPYVYVEPTSGRVFDIDLQGVNGAHLSYSDDGGKTWTDSLLTTAGVNDHQTLVAGPLPEGGGLLPLSDPKFQKVLYYCTNGIAYGSCARSYDGGRTFTQANQTGYQAINPGYLATFDLDHNEGICGSLHGHAVTDYRGRLFIPRGYCQIPMIGISEDAGTTFTDVQVAKVLMSGQQASVAVDKLGNVYYVFQDAEHNQPYLVVSRDHGRHWGTPIMIAPPGVNETNFPTIDVGDPGRIAITFPGSTSTLGHKDTTRPWNSYVVVSTNALSTDPLFLSNIANPKNDPVARGDCSNRCGRMYDFLDIVSAPDDQGRVYATAVDTCTSLLSCSSKRVPGNYDSNDVVQEETAHDYGASADMQGVIIREVSGPALRGRATAITHDAAR
ncbi:MAG: hypothetical protein QOJ48_1929 [Frankiales bacterium]|nr:hypothetical protein [Frankiales bacterium]